MSRNIFNYNNNDIIFDDVETNDEYNNWSRICESCRSKHNITDGDQCSIDYDFGSGICGVEGCNNEAEHYIDFKIALIEV